MFFDQFKKSGKSPNGRNGPVQGRRNEAGKPNSAALLAVDGQPALPVGELRRTVDPASLGFASTEELEPVVGLIGQERALKAIDFGAKMDAQDFNIFVLGPPASGKSTAVRAYLERKIEAPATATDLGNGVLLVEDATTITTPI